MDAVAPFNAALSACARAGRANAALDLLNGLRRAPLGTGGLAPEASSLAEYGAGNWPRADVVSYNACLGALVQGRHHALAVSLFRDLDGSLGPQIKPDAVSFQLGLAALAGAGDGDGAVALLGRMERQEAGAPLPDSQAYSALARAATAAGNSALATEAKNRARAMSPAAAAGGGGLSGVGATLGGKAQQWVCPSCGWRNRPQNDLCGGNNNQVNGASGRPTCGCGKSRPVTPDAGAPTTTTVAATPSTSTTTTTRAFKDEDLFAAPVEGATAAGNYDTVSDGIGDESEDIDVEDEAMDFDDSVWTISEGQAVEVWDRGRLILGNAVLNPPATEGQKDKKKSSQSPVAAGAKVLHVLVFDPKEHLVGGAKDDDLDEHNAAGRAKVASKSSVMDATRVVKRFALDQVVSAWDLSAAENEVLREVGSSDSSSLSSYYYPYSAAEWSRCVRDASVLAQQLPARRGAPEEVWQASKRADAAQQAALKKMKKKQQQKQGKEPVGIPDEGAASTVKVAQYLLDGEFYEGSQGRFDHAAQASQLLSEGDPSGLVRVRAAAHWHAASLLGASQFHFKRVVAAPAPPEEDEGVPALAGAEAEAALAKEEETTTTTPETTKEEDVPALESLLGQGADPKAIAQMRAMLGSLNGGDNDKGSGKGGSKKKANNEGKEVSSEPVEEAPALRVTGGGWRPLAPSVVVSREALHFAKTIQTKRAQPALPASSQGSSSEGSGDDLSSSWKRASVRRIADQLELLALGGGPVLLGPEAKAALQALQQQLEKSSSPSQGGKSFTAEVEATPEVAQQILLDLGHWTSKLSPKSAAAGAGTTTSSSSSSEAAEPWSAEALNHATTAAEAIAMRRRRLANMAPNPVVKTAEATTQEGESVVPLSAGFRLTGAEDLVPGSSDAPTFAAATALAERGARGRNNNNDADDVSISEVAWLEGWPAEWSVGPHGRVDLRGDDRMV